MTSMLWHSQLIPENPKVCMYCTMYGGWCYISYIGWNIMCNCSQLWPFRRRIGVAISLPMIYDLKNAVKSKDIMWLTLGLYRYSDNRTYWIVLSNETLYRLKAIFDAITILNVIGGNWVTWPNKSDVKCRNTLGCLDQYMCKVLRLWNRQDCETV